MGPVSTTWKFYLQVLKSFGYKLLNILLHLLAWSGSDYF